MAGKRVKTPRYRVLSARVSEEEYQAFQKAADKADVSVSRMVRTVMLEQLKVQP